MNVLIALLVLMAGAEQVHAERFVIDSNHSLPVFEVNHLGFSTQRGRFNETRGSIELDRKAGTGRVEFTIVIDSIDMGSSKWDEHMKSPDFFNAKAFPEANFVSKSFTFKGENPVAAEGTLTLLGVSRPLKVKIENFTCGENSFVKKSLCAANIEATLKRSEFGMNRFLPAISDEVAIHLPIEAFREGS